MNAKEFAEQLKSEIQSIANQGQESVKVDVLTEALDRFIQSSSEESETIKIERLKAYLQAQVEIEKYNHLADLEMFKSVIQSGQNAIKINLLLNGGAAIALLAFIGKLTDTNHSKIPLFAQSLTLFVVGALFTALGAGITYLTQLTYSKENKWAERFGVCLNTLSIFLGVGALSLFAYGVYHSYSAFIALAT
ncbi:hypothetical protein [Pseudomonas tussilaginis]|uniref:hypothetical protein n=1 Tax=Pseudomonas putida TaxID=303 RepID=UPI0023641209|nr:hypothetical protein [Pseudomonas putida]MDD1979630.1 hypothetical protein [Pseudomonas putida]